MRSNKLPTQRAGTAQSSGYPKYVGISTRIFKLYHLQKGFEQINKEIYNCITTTTRERMDKDNVLVNIYIHSVSEYKKRWGFSSTGLVS